MSTKKTVSIITSTLPPQHGGRTKSLLQRARIFSRHNIKTKIYTTNYNENYDEVYARFTAEGKVNDDIEMYNIYDYYRGDSKKTPSNYQSFIDKELSTLSPAHPDEPCGLKRVKGSHVTAYYTGGMVQYHVSTNTETGKVKNVDFYQPYFKESVARAYTNNNENVHKISYFEPITKRLIADVFLTNDFHPYVTREYTYNGEKKKLARVILNQGKDKINVFPNEREFFAHWLEELFSDGDIVICDARLLDWPLLNVSKDVRKIFQLHSTHLSDPLNVNSPLRSDFATLLERDLKPSEIIISLTNIQKKEMIARLNNIANNTVSIPHSIKTHDIEYPANMKQICIVTRLTMLKKVQHAIKAFNLFNFVKKGYTLVIYGEGDDLKRQQEVIAHRKLNDKVLLKGFTSKPEQIFEGSAFSLLTSAYEGFPLSVLESMSRGCPVISYDIRYGPAEMLDSKSGRIAKWNRPLGLAWEMYKEANNPRSRDEVRARAKRYSEEAFFEKWSKLLVDEPLDLKDVT